MKRKLEAAISSANDLLQSATKKVNALPEMGKKLLDSSLELAQSSIQKVNDAMPESGKQFLNSSLEFIQVSAKKAQDEFSKFVASVPASLAPAAAPNFGPVVDGPLANDMGFFSEEPGFVPAAVPLPNDMDFFSEEEIQALIDMHAFDAPEAKPEAKPEDNQKPAKEEAAKKEVEAAPKAPSLMEAFEGKVPVKKQSKLDPIVLKKRLDALQKVFKKSIDNPYAVAKLTAKAGDKGFFMVSQEWVSPEEFQKISADKRAASPKPSL